MDQDFQEVKERIRQECDLVEVASHYVDLKLKGKYYWGLCPFHNEKTPSFHIAQERQLFYCFGCQTGGDLFHFMEKIEQLTFREAFERLAEWAGIDINDIKEDGHVSPENQKRRQIKEAHKFAANFYRYILLNTKQGKKALDYLEYRNFDQSTIEAFWLGYAPDHWTALYDYLKKKGFADETLVEAGLCTPRKTKEGVYDRFRSRLMFPIANQRGEIVGFGGRLIEEKEEQPKYLNTPETSVFNKRKVLYGLNKSYKQIRMENRALILEGYTDVIRLHQHGIRIALAPLGTALTWDQAKMIKRNANKALIAFDADEAGQSSTIKGMEILWDTGIDVKVCQLPFNYDPDDYVDENGIKRFEEEIMANALPLVEFRMRQLSENKNLSTVEGKKEYISEVIPVLAKINNEVEREAYLQNLSNQLEVSVNSLQVELSKYMQNMQTKHKTQRREQTKREKSGDMNRGSQTEVKSENKKGQSKREKAEQELLTLMFHSPEYIEVVKDEIDPHDFEDDNHAMLAYKIFQWFDEGKALNSTQLIDELRETENGKEMEKIITIIAMKDFPFPKNIRKFIQDCTAIIKKSKIQAQRKEMERELAQINSELEPEKRDQLLAKINECLRIEKSAQRTLEEGG